jgi:glycosyltransferase involved in cell wall biosynthesis
MMRLAVLTTNLARGGAETQAASLACCLAARGWEARAFSLLPPSALVEELRAAGVAVGPHGFARLVPALLRFKPHILHAHLFHANVTARAIRLVCPVPVVISTIHSLAESSRRSPNITRRDLAYRATDWLSDATVCVSAAVAERHLSARAVTGKRLRVIFNGVDTECFRPDPDLRARLRSELGLGSGFVWLAVGRLMWKKNYPLLLEAMARLGAGSLLIAGDGPDAVALRAQADRLRVNARFLGTRQDIPALMNAADGFVLSSVVEGLPMVLLEAAACGLPQVAPAVGGVKEALLDGRTGFIAPSSESDALAAAMTRLMSLSPEVRTQMARQARDHAIACFDLPRVASQWEDLYNQLLDTARRDATPG